LEVVQRRAPKGTEEKNLQALEIGFELARKKRVRKSH
jgi:Pyruvate/2-oxoacid:ferredoxin oxidoreductase gamma subunit